MNVVKRVYFGPPPFDMRKIHSFDGAGAKDGGGVVDAGFSGAVCFSDGAVSSYQVLYTSR